MFKNRLQAGQQLAQALSQYQAQEQDKKVLVLPIARGGAELGLAVARALQAELDLLIVRRLPLPHNPETGFGAMAEDGSIYLEPRAKMALSAPLRQRTMAEQKQEIKRRIDSLRQGQDLAEIKDKIVIIVDDGVAVGSTMIAALKMCAKEQPAQLIAAAPVAPRSARLKLESFADQVILLQTPVNFRAVSQFYQQWHDISDQEVRKIMKQYQASEA